jgi:cytochrome c2
VPEDFEVTARYAPGYSDWKPWTATITRDGKVSQTTLSFGDAAETKTVKTFSLSQSDVADLADSIRETNFFAIREEWSYTVTDNPTLILSVTMGGASHRVRVYAPDHLRVHPEVQRFLQLWNVVLKKVPSPNEAASVQPPPSVVASADDTPEEMLIKMGCGACHQIPTTALKFGRIGPVLVGKTTASVRLASPEYQAQKKTGKAHASTPKEYLIEAIVEPSAFVVPGFEMKSNPQISMMPKDYGNKFTYEAFDTLVDFLLSIDESGR